MNFKRHLNLKQHRRFQTGETLIEVIIATLIFAVGILGNIGLQSASVMNNKSSLHQTKAILAANELAMRIRANRTAALNGAYNGYDSTNPPSDPNCNDSPCNGVNRATADLFEWSQNFTNVYSDPGYLVLLPGGTAQVDYDANAAEYSIRVFWVEQAYTSSEIGSIKTDRSREHQLILTI